MIKRLHGCKARGRLPGPSGLHDGQEQEEEGGWLYCWWRAQIISSSLPSLSLPLSLSLPSPHRPTPPNPSHSMPWSTFLQIPAQYSSWGCSSCGGGGGACGVSAEGRYNTQKSWLKQKAEHLLKWFRGKYVWQLLFTVTVVTVSTAKSKPRHFSICSETDGPTAIH